MEKSTSSVCDVRRSSVKKYVPIVTRICLAPLNFIFVFILGLMNLDFSSYAWDGFERSHEQLYLSASMDTFVSLVFLTLIYLSILKLTRTWSRNTIMAGITYLIVFQIFFVIFSMTDIVMLLKQTVEYTLHYIGSWSFNDTLTPEAITVQKNQRDFWISVIYFLGNTLLSTSVTRLFSHFFRPITV